MGVRDHDIHALALYRPGHNGAQVEVHPVLPDVGNVGFGDEVHRLVQECGVRLLLVPVPEQPEEVVAHLPGIAQLPSGEVGAAELPREILHEADEGGRGVADVLLLLQLVVSGVQDSFKRTEPLDKGAADVVGIAP